MEKRVRRYWRKVLAFVSCMIFVASGVLPIQAAETYREIPLEWQEACQGENSLADSVCQDSALTGSVLAGNARQDTEKEKNSTNLQLYAQSAVLMDADSGRILFGKNEKEQMPMASTTKIMTCILALENGNMEDVVTVSAYAAGQPKVHLGMREGQQFRLGDLLYSLMLESHNDTAVAIAEHIGGSVEGFAGLMNRKAKDIGCFDTFFVTPNGLDATVTDSGGNTRVHSTTAGDLARIMKYCITESEKKEDFLEITRTQSHFFTDEEKQSSYSCNNHNAFLTMMDGALTGKTGFTNNAGYCYVGALRRDGKTFIVSLLACGWPNNRNYKWSDTKKLMTYGLENYEYRNVYEPVSIKPLPVRDGIPESGNPYEEAYVALSVDEREKEWNLLLKEGEGVERKIHLPNGLNAPLKEGSEAGSVGYYLNGELIKECPIIIEADVEKRNFRWILQYILKRYML